MIRGAVTRGAVMRGVVLAQALALAACSAGGSAGSGTTTGSTAAPPPLTTPLVDATTGRPLGDSPDAALDRLANGASAGALLARSTDARVCIFANGRNGWNRAAC